MKSEEKFPFQINYYVVLKLNQKKLSKMKKQIAMKKQEDLPPLQETLKQKIQIKASKIRRYEKRTKFYRQNTLQVIQKEVFFRKLGSKQINVEKPTTEMKSKIDEIEIFWKKKYRTRIKNSMKMQNS